MGESTKLVPEEYKPEHTRKSEPEDSIGRNKDKTKSYPWDSGTPREPSESEKLVPEAYRPCSSAGGQEERSSASRASIVPAQQDPRVIGSVVRIFMECLEDPGSKPDNVLREQSSETMSRK